MKYLIYLFLLSIAFGMKLELLEMFHTSVAFQPKGINSQIQKLETQIQKLKEQKRQKWQECEKLNKDLTTMKNEKDKNEKFTIWLMNRIQTNNKRVANLQDLTCTASSNYYQLMGIQIKVKRILSFLSEWNKKEQSLAQLQETISFVQELQEDNELQGNQQILEQIRVCKINPGQQRKEISDLTSMLSETNEHISQSNDKFSINQIRSQESIKKFIFQLQKETESLSIHLDQIQKIISRNPIYDCQNKRLEQCQKDLITFDRQIQCTQTALDNIKRCQVNECNKYLYLETQKKQMKILGQITKEYSNGVQQLQENK